MARRRRPPVQRGPLTGGPPAPEVGGDQEPPPTTAGRETTWVADHSPATRDATPAYGTPGEPASWRRADPDGDVALARPAWGDAQWSYLFKADTGYADVEPEPGEVAAANRTGRARQAPAAPHGPFLKAPVWTWEGPLYFWVGGIASGSAFVALAADLAGDKRSATLARRVALAAVLPAPVLLIADLGRPGRFLNMLRIFKPRSPMITGAWCLVGFSTTGAAAVGADLLGRPRAARALGGATALLGGYLGSYTGVLLAATAVPLWARSRLFLGPIFVSTATATGAAACRLVLVADGVAPGHPTLRALGGLEAGGISAELVLSTFNERRLGRTARALREGRGGRWFRAAKVLVRGGLALQLVPGRAGPAARNMASGAYLAGGLCFRYAWVDAGKTSAGDHEAVAGAARGHVAGDAETEEVRPPRRVSRQRRPWPVAAAGRAWSATVGRLSLLADGTLRRLTGRARRDPGRPPYPVGEETALGERERERRAPPDQRPAR
jgi:formate-dependent nitrite reductase membrane component NrfD